MHNRRQLADNVQSVKNRTVVLREESSQHPDLRAYVAGFALIGSFLDKLEEQIRADGERNRAPLKRKRSELQLSRDLSIRRVS